MKILFYGGSEDGIVKEFLENDIKGFQVHDFKNKMVVGYYMRTEKNVDDAVVFEFVRSI